MHVHVSLHVDYKETYFVGAEVLHGHCLMVERRLGAVHWHPGLTLLNIDIQHIL